MRDVYVSRRDVGTNLAGDPVYKAPVLFKAHVETNTDTDERGGSGQSDKATTVLITSTEVERGDMLWLPGTEPDSDEPVRVMSVEKFIDPESGELHHYEVGI